VSKISCALMLAFGPGEANCAKQRVDWAGLTAFTHFMVAVIF